MAGLNPKQVNFCQEYAKSFNATAAYKKAYGCGDKTANNNGAVLLKRPLIKAHLKKILSAAVKRNDIKTDELLQTFIAIRDLDPLDYIEKFCSKKLTIEFKDIKKIPVEIRRLIQSVRVINSGENRCLEIKFVDKQFALKMLANYTGGFSERTDHTTGGDKIEKFDIVVDNKKTADKLQGLINGSKGSTDNKDV